ncbi:single strand DNA binding protein [Flavobacterium phage Fpv1]|uniref:DUF3127 domain-containing protein n=4 Tax=Fipvunavirus TaxID=2560132 RepID=A0A1B0WM43_9CAUD|nr:single strand DNA binding protein [Flavobacterium phage Fpv3]YP_009321942.1 single strand DNA binding protein [Flavobacterium phage Fpv20]YP_009322075.1 single strand DNA binding protein [Flavobacterium phage Fpv1]YP_009323664.1 single strand DNA binding protein [Flavobacterium phage Fpv2]YP_009594120.1 single strand DNA binding protein [Flavobacterium phage FpV4]ALN97316.1 hypothetical protein [Flavobacterium phage FpV21]QCW20266.1 hypothetical protein [Flavobacterium phage FPSV-F12]QCW2
MSSNRKTYNLEGKVIISTDVVQIERRDGNPFSKRTIGVETNEKQVVFFESRVDLDNEWQIGEQVKVQYYFAGSIKGDKIYNNIIASKILPNG